MTDGNLLNAKCIHDVVWFACDQGCVGSPVIDAGHIERQREWSRKTFGPGTRILGVIKHIRKELEEVLDTPEDPAEWADIIILAIDGAWRSGIEPQAIINSVIAKQAENEARDWPDWRDQPEDEPIEHVREPVCEECGGLREVEREVHRIRANNDKVLGVVKVPCPKCAS